MIRALDATIAKLATLPAEKQDRIAQWLLDERLDEEWAAYRELPPEIRDLTQRVCWLFRQNPRRVRTGAPGR